MSKSADEHKAEAPTNLNFAVITISTSRYEKIQAGRSVENPSGDIAIKLLEGAGHKVVYYDIISDNADLIKKSLERVLGMSSIDAVVTCGGTGITRTDITVETVTPLLEKDLQGFGELFRKLSYEKIGSAAIITRATAGLIKGKVVFCIPGSPQAVEMALISLIIPEVGHIVRHTRE